MLPFLPFTTFRIPFFFPPSFLLYSLSHISPIPASTHCPFVPTYSIPFVLYLFLFPLPATPHPTQAYSPYFIPSLHLYPLFLHISLFFYHLLSSFFTQYFFLLLLLLPYPRLVMPPPLGYHLLPCAPLPRPFTAPVIEKLPLQYPLGNQFIIIGSKGVRWRRIVATDRQEGIVDTKDYNYGHCRKVYILYCNRSWRIRMGWWMGRLYLLVRAKRDCRELIYNGKGNCTVRDCGFWGIVNSKRWNMEYSAS